MRIPEQQIAPASAGVMSLGRSLLWCRGGQGAINPPQLQRELLPVVLVEEGREEAPPAPWCCAGERQGSAPAALWTAELGVPGAQRGRLV